MKYNLLAGALLAALSVTACSGGGGSTGGVSPVPVPVASSTPGLPVPHGNVVFVSHAGSLKVNGVAVRLPQSSTRKTASVSSLSSVVESAGSVQYTIGVDVLSLDSNSQPQPEPAPSVSILTTTPSVAVIGGQPVNFSGSLAWTVGVSPQNIGTTTMGAQFPDSAGNIPVKITDSMSWGCVASVMGASGAFRFAPNTNGIYVATPLTSNVSSDVYITGPTAPCDSQWTGPVGQQITFVFAYGYEVVAPPAPDSTGNLLPAFANISSVGTFTSVGNSLPQSQIQYGEVIIFRTSSGRFVKWMPVSGIPDCPPAGGACYGDYLGVQGIDIVSDLTGAFPL